MKFLKNLLFSTLAAATLLSSQPIIAKTQAEQKLEHKLVQELPQKPKNNLKNYSPLIDYQLKSSFEQKNGQNHLNYEELETTISSYHQLNFSLTNWLQLDLNNSKVSDMNKKFSWNFGDEDLYYQNQSLSNILTNTFDLENNPDSIIVNDYRLKDFIKNYQNELNVVGPLIENHFSDLLTDLSQFYGQNPTEFNLELFLFLLQTMPKYTNDGMINPEESTQFVNDLSEFINEYYQNDLTPKEQQKINQILNSFTDNVNQTLENTSLDEQLTGLSDKNALQNITLGGVPLDQILNISTEMYDLLNVQVEENKISGNLNLSLSVNSFNDFHFRQKLIQNKKNFLFEHSNSLNAQFTAGAHLNFLAEYLPGADISDFLADSSLTETQIDLLLAMTGGDFKLYDLNAHAEAGYNYGYLLKFNDTYQLSQFLPHGKEGFGFSREMFKNYHKSQIATVNSSLKTSDKKFQLEAVDQKKERNDAGYQNIIYIFNQQNLDFIWFYSLAGLKEEKLSFSENTKTSTFLFEKDFADIYAKPKTEKDKSSDSQKKHTHQVIPIGTLTLGFNNLPVTPFISITNLVNSPRAGLFINTFNHKSKIAASEEGLELDTYLILVGNSTENHQDNIFTDYFRETEILNNGPQKSNHAIKQTLDRKLYSEFNGLVLVSHVDKDQYNAGVVLSNSGNFFLNLNYLNEAQNEANGISTMFGNKDFSVSAEYLHQNSIENKLISHNFELGASGTIEDWYVDFIFKCINNEQFNNSFYTYRDSEDLHFYLVVGKKL